MIHSNTIKNKLYSITKQAYKALNKGRYVEATLLLEDISKEMPDNYYILYLLSVSYVLTEKYSSYESIINKINRLKVDYFPFEELEAFIYLKSSSSKDSTIVKYLKYQEIYNESKFFPRILKKLRLSTDFNSFQKNLHLLDAVSLPAPTKKIFENNNYIEDKYENNNGQKNKINNSVLKKNYISKIRLNFNLKIILFPLLLFIVIFVSYVSFSFFSGLFKNSRKFNNNTEINSSEIDYIDIKNLKYSMIDKLVQNKTPFFYYSEKNLLTDFESAKKMVKSKQYNQAIIIINKIINSNANISVVEKAKFIHDFILQQDKREPYDIAYKDIIEKPFLYKGLFLRWPGKVTNLKIKKDKSSFNLLLDYKNDETFEGVIDVFMEESINEKIKNGDFVLLDAIFINTVGKNSGVYLLGKDIKLKK